MTGRITPVAKRRNEVMEAFLADPARYLPHNRFHDVSSANR